MFAFTFGFSHSAIEVVYTCEIDIYRHRQKNGDAILHTSQDESIFWFHDTNQGDNFLEVGNTVMVQTSDIDGHPVYKNLKLDSVYSKRPLPFYSSRAIIQQPIDKIDWKFQSGDKTIGGYRCKSARGSFGGREYIAWFTFDIPISNGPHKLGGLPGLILEAYSTDGFVKYNFKSLKKSNFTYQRDIQKPRGKIVLGAEESWRLVNEALDRKQKEYRAKLDENGYGASVGLDKKAYVYSFEKDKPWID